jgi:uncharacterized membrane protein
MSSCAFLATGSTLLSSPSPSLVSRAQPLERRSVAAGAQRAATRPPRRRRSAVPRAAAVVSEATAQPPPPPPPPASECDSFRLTRKVLAALASLGVAETAFLSAAKLFASPAAICRTGGCIEVLAGPYSSFLGVPLSAAGVLAYAAFAFLAAWPLGARGEEAIVSDDGEVEQRSAEDVYAIRDAATRPLLLALASVLLVFSAYFMFLLTVVIRDTCPYCVFSAVLSTTLFAVTAFFGRAVRGAGRAIKIGGSSALVSALAAAAVFLLSSPGGLLAKMPSEPQAPPVVTEQSDSRTIAIGRKLKKRGAKMYGAYWCSHCFDQKQRLGRRAFSNVTYVECDKGGVDTQAKLCRERRIPGYPTWEIDGEQYPGELTIDDLERLASGLPLTADEKRGRE